MGMMGWGRPAMLQGLLATGCSLSIHGPGADAGHTARPICDDNSGFVVLDGIGAGVTGSVTGLTVISASESTNNDGSDFAVIAVVFGALAVLETASALRGHHEVSACRAAKRRYRETHARAIQIVTTARTSARAGDCAFVVDLGHRLKAIDTTAFTEAFTTDPDIKRCLPAP